MRTPSGIRGPLIALASAVALVAPAGATAAVTANDLDGDGLSNRTERRIGTNPRRADTDGDGLRDGREVRLGTNPRKADTDGDGETDAYEVANGTDPLVAETVATRSS